MRPNLSKISFAFFSGLAALAGTTAADARSIIVDASLNPTLIRTNLELPTGSGCAGNVCQVTLPYTVNFGAVTTNQIFVYNSGIVSLGAALPVSAFSSSPSSIPNFFGGSSYNIMAAGYRPDDTGTPAPVDGGSTGMATAEAIRAFARNSIGFCQGGPPTVGRLSCPPGYTPGVPDKEPFLDPFIAINNLGRFEGDINIKLGNLSYIVFKKPVDGFVDVELFQYYQFNIDNDPVYVGMKNDMVLYYPGNTTFLYRFALASSGVPEPSTWLMMIAGFGMVGGALRRRNVRTSVSYA